MAAYRTGITHMQPGNDRYGIRRTAIRRVTAIFNEVIPEDEQLEFVQVWLPPELAKQVKEMAKPYQNKN